jgi:hypothetical protein
LHDENTEMSQKRHRSANRRSRRGGVNRVPLVRLEGNKIIFDERVNAAAHRDFMRQVQAAIRAGVDSLVLDFSASKRTFADGMVPILCGVEAIRREGMGVVAVLPEESSARRLFLNANWAHSLDPQTYPETDTTFDRHLAAQRFRTFTEQQLVVDQIMDVAMRNMNVSREVLDGLEWSINEVTDNVLNHAQSPDGGLVQVTTYGESGLIGFVVGDSGCGILASMREGHPKLRSDAHAIGEAVKAGVTRNPDAGQGNGLAGTLRIALLSGGSFALTSGIAHLQVLSDVNGAGRSKTYDRRQSQYFQGTVVSAFIKQHATFNMADALAFPGIPYSRFDIIDAKYETEDGSALTMRLAEETAGFGTRGAGRQVRTKCINLLNAEPDKPLVLNWEGVPLISSSFADEAVGKLFVELGPTGFMARVRNAGMERLVRVLVDKAIMQRTAQALSDTPYLEEDDD